MKTVADIEYVREELKSIFPDAVRGSVAKSNWGRGRKQLHLAYFIGADSVSGFMVQARGNLLYFIDWSTNDSESGEIFAERDSDAFISRLRTMFGGRKYKIDRTVCEPSGHKGQ